MSCGAAPTPSHHATSGNLDRRGIGDVDTLTVDEYRARSLLGPAALPPVPPSAGDVRPRPGLSVPPAASPADRPDARPAGGRGSSTMATNLAIASDRRGLIWLVGFEAVPAGASADHAARRLDRRLAVLRPAPVRGDDLGRATTTGICTTPPCTAARITTCRRSCAGSPPISASTTCIISAAGSPITGCRGCCAIIRSCAMSAG